MHDYRKLSRLVVDRGDSRRKKERKGWGGEGKRHGEVRRNEVGEEGVEGEGSGEGGAGRWKGEGVGEEEKKREGGEDKKEEEERRCCGGG